MGGLMNFMPLSYVLILIASLSLIGFPYLTGFYSKEKLLELVYEKYLLVFGYLLSTITVLFTAFYSIRSLYLTFLTNPNSKKDCFIKVHESN